jgi:LDH2 family malate/lactate/ureidoglycolate dehydrogenase
MLISMNFVATFTAESLSAFAVDILLRLDVPKEKAELVAASLVASNLRGVDSHGMQLLPSYAEQISRGNILPRAEGRVLSESGACMSYDGEHGIGQVIAATCADHAVRICRAHGSSMVTARESSHYGAAAFWAQRIAAHGFIGITMCNASPLVAPWQGKEPRLGTNPLCMALPGPRIWLLDMATTTVALNKIRNASQAGKDTIPEGWAMDSQGKPTTDTATALHGLLMPLGGYKGSGLAMMVDILCAVLGGGVMSADVGSVHNLNRPMRTSQMFLAIDVARFLPADEFVGRMKRLAQAAKSSAPAAGFDEVLIAGEPEWREEARRKQNGIPITAGAWELLVNVARKLGVALPSPSS